MQVPEGSIEGGFRDNWATMTRQRFFWLRARVLIVRVSLGI